MTDFNGNHNILLPIMPISVFISSEFHAKIS